MLRRFGHGHSTGIGFLLALLLMRHAFLFAVLIFAAGFLAGRSWLVWLRVGDAARRYFTKRADKIKPRVQARVSMLRNDDIPF